MLVRLLLVMSLVMAVFASRAPVELANEADAVAMVDVLDAIMAAQTTTPVQPPQVTSEFPADPDLAPPSPELGRVFRPPRVSSS